MTDIPVNAILDRHRVSAGLTHEQCWNAFFAMGGHSDPAAVKAFLNGTGPLPQSEIDILAAAIGDQSETGHDHPGSASTESPVVIELIDAGFMRDTSPRLTQLLQGLNADPPLLGSISILGAPRGPDESRHPDSSQPWQPVRLADSSIVMQPEQVMAIRAQPGSAPAKTSAMASANLLRVDAATSFDWEIHSTGDELLVLLSGGAEIAVDRTASSLAVLQDPYQACIIPRGRWHRHIATQADTRLLYLTPIYDTRTLNPDADS